MKAHTTTTTTQYFSCTPASAGRLHGRWCSGEQRKMVFIRKSTPARRSSHILETMYAAVSVTKYEMSLVEDTMADSMKELIGFKSSAKRLNTAPSRPGVQHQKTLDMAGREASAASCSTLGVSGSTGGSGATSACFCDEAASGGSEVSRRGCRPSSRMATPRRLSNRIAALRMLTAGRSRSP